MRSKKVNEPLDEKRLFPTITRMCMFDKTRPCNNTCAGYNDYEYANGIECLRTGKRIKIMLDDDE